MNFYKTIDLFGNEEKHVITKRRISNKTIFDDYNGFVEKFEVKKTTDDCYTPKEVYKIVLEYVNKNYPLNGLKIIRPFYPEGDFESIDYPPNCIVIDNPPFSIITKICRYYIDKGVRFFLFCPHLTAFSSDIECTHIIASADITYENGATIKTAFITNVFGDVKIIGDAELNSKFKELNVRDSVKLPKYKYPDNIITVSKIAYFVEKGISIKIDKKEVKHCRGLDAQKKHKKSLFGSGFIVSKRAAAAAAAAAEDEVIVWELSQKELAIINDLNNGTSKKSRR